VRLIRCNNIRMSIRPLVSASALNLAAHGPVPLFLIRLTKVAFSIYVDEAYPLHTRGC